MNLLDQQTLLDPTRGGIVLDGAKVLRYHQKVRKYLFANLITYWRLNNGPAGNEYLTYNGSTTTVSAGSGATLDDLPDAEFTAECWIYPTAGASFQQVFGKWNTNQGWKINNGTNQRASVTLEAATTDSTKTSTTDSNPLNAWNHLTIYFNDAGDRAVRIAVNGTWQSGSAASGAYQTDAAENLVMGIAGYTGRIGWCRISTGDRHGVDVNFTPPSRTTIPAVDGTTVGLWPMNEGYGSVAGDLSANNNDGTITAGDWGAYPSITDTSEYGRLATYVGPLLANTACPPKIGGMAPWFDSVNDYIAAYSGGFNASFDEALGTVMFWAKVDSVADWTDGVYRNMFNIGADANNKIYIGKHSISNQINFSYTAGGTSKAVSLGGQSDTDWMFVAITWNVASDRVRAYKNAVQVGGDLTTLGTWSGALANSQTVIGASNNTPSNCWSGWLSNFMLLNKEATLAEIQQVYNWGV